MVDRKPSGCYRIGTEEIRKAVAVDIGQLDGIPVGAL